MKWDFSAVSAAGEPEQIRGNLYDYINSRIRAFAGYYRDYLADEIRINQNNAQDSFQSMLNAIQQADYRLYLLIDEYDNFANEVMMGTREISRERYKALVYGEGCVKALFKVVKSASTGLDRAFITGVSPVVMSDITSGHNIAENIYLMPEFNDLCGFRESEVDNMLEKISELCKLPAEKKQKLLI
ncbi:MAG: AAA family ATPase [Desulfobacteraceae bacterium]|nr:AAA family ATPase [Desulfobacteraceae bacterium]